MVKVVAKISRMHMFFTVGKIAAALSPGHALCIWLQTFIEKQTRNEKMCKIFMTKYESCLTSCYAGGSISVEKAIQFIVLKILFQNIRYILVNTRRYPLWFLQGTLLRRQTVMVSPQISQYQYYGMVQCRYAAVNISSYLL